MKQRSHATFFASLFLILTFSKSAFGQELTAAERALIEAEAQRHVEYYYNLYYERNPQSLSTEIFTLPWYITGGNGITVNSTEEENLEYFSSAIQGLLEQGWDKSTFRTKNVCVLSAGSAIVSGTNTRSRADGSIMSVGGVSYILGTTEGGWRIISFSGHSPDNVIRCDPE